MNEVEKGSDAWSSTAHEEQKQPASCRLTSGGGRVLTRTSTGTLARDDRPLDEELTAPDAPRLLTLKRTGKALRERRARLTQGLGEGVSSQSSSITPVGAWRATTWMASTFQRPLIFQGPSRENRW